MLQNSDNQCVSCRLPHSYVPFTVMLRGSTIFICTVSMFLGVILQLTSDKHVEHGSMVKV